MCLWQSCRWTWDSLSAVSGSIKEWKWWLLAAHMHRKLIVTHMMITYFPKLKLTVNYLWYTYNNSRCSKDFLKIQNPNWHDWCWDNIWNIFFILRNDLITCTGTVDCHKKTNKKTQSIPWSYHHILRNNKITNKNSDEI